MISLRRNRMRRRVSVWALLAWVAASVPVLAAQSPEIAGSAALEDLGDGRYRIGAIEIDKTASSFVVPGVVLKLLNDTMPVEFLAVSKNGPKSYEAVIELDTSATDFNLACILIGLSDEGATHPGHHFDPAVVRGDRVSLKASWEREGAVVRLPLGQLIQSEGEKVTEDWVYTGSFFNPAGVYVAQEVGTLIGVVHDPESIIQHRTGLGLGAYGAVQANRAALPAPGTSMVVWVKKLD